MEVDLADLVHHILVVEGDEAEAPVPVGDLVVGQHGLLHLRELLKVGLNSKRSATVRLLEVFSRYLNVLETSCGRQTSNKDLLGSHHQLWVCLARYSNLETSHV